MGVILLPYELSKQFNNSRAKDSSEIQYLLLVQKILYYSTLFLSYVINPVFMEYKKLKEQENNRNQRELQSQDNSEYTLETDPEYSTSNSLFMRALKNQLVYYVILLSVLMVILIVSLSLLYHFHVEIDFFSYMSIFPSISNVYNLIWYGITIGFGIVRIPILICRRSSYLFPIREASAQLADDDISLECHRYLVDQVEIEYKKVKKIRKNRCKQILRQVFFIICTILVSLLSISYILLEVFSLVKLKIFESNAPLQFLLNKVNFEVINQIILFLFIGSLSFIGGYSLSCLNIGSLCVPSTRSSLGKVIALINYRFVPNGTESSTFGSWSSYLQTLLPTIAYHCQLLSGCSESSLAVILGKFNENPDFTFYCDIFLLCLVGLTSFISLARIFATRDKDVIEKGYNIFKKEKNIEDDLIIDNLIVCDVKINDEEIWNRNPRRTNQNNEVRIPSNDLNGYHNRLDEPPINLSDIVLGTSSDLINK